MIRLIIFSLLLISEILLFGQCNQLEEGQYGDCLLTLGIIWNGENCQSISGCSTINSNYEDDSHHFFNTIQECIEICNTTNSTPGDINNDGFVNVVRN